MSKSEILEWFTANNEALQADKIIFILLLSMAVGAVIFVTYRVAFRGVAYNAGFNVSNVALVMIAATIMLMISSNIAISLGMVGALSIVRFRTAIKDPKDTMYIFWAIIEGLCVGAQIYELALISTLIIALFLLAGSFYSVLRKKYLIIIRGNGEVKQEAALEALRGFYGKSTVRSANYGEGHCELICEVNAADGVSDEAAAALRMVDGVAEISILLETGEHIG